MDWWLLTFLLGAILSLFLPIVPAIFHVFLFLGLACAAFLHQSTRKFSLLFVGVAWLLFHGAQYQSIWLDNQLSLDNLSYKPVELRGKVTSIAVNKTKDKNKSYRFNFAVSHLNNQKLNRTLHIRLTWKTGKLQPLQGQVWQFKAKIKPAHGFANPGSFSYQTWLRKNIIHGTGYVINAKTNTLISAATSFRQSQYLKLNKLLLTLNQESKLHPMSALVFALSFGEKGKLSKDHWRVLKATATQHLMAISGLHLGLVASGSYFLLLLLLRLPVFSLINPQRQQALLQKNNRLFAIFFSCLITLVYAYSAGFSVPTVRAFLMISLLWAMKLSGIKLSLTRWLLFVVFVVIILSPFSLFSVSFWLSFYAVSIIFLLFWRFKNTITSHEKIQSNKVLHWATSLVKLQLTLAIMMIPLTVFLSYQFSLVGIFANLIAVPLMSVTAIPLCLLTVLMMPISEPIALLLLDATLFCLSVIWLWLSYLADSNLSLIAIPFELLLLLTFIILLLLSLFLVKIRRTSILLTLFILLLGLHFYYPSLNSWWHKKAKDRNWQVRVMDVGQGLAVFIEVNSELMLYDTGASYPSGFNIADSVLLPYLKYRGVQGLHSLVISHDDNDHAGGLLHLNQQLSIERLVYNNSSALPLLSDESCMQGQIKSWHFLTIEQLWPQENKAAHNDDSCVVKISDGQHSVLLTGDISTKVERQLVDFYNVSGDTAKVLPQSLKTDLLIVPHHGSKTSSSAEFLQAVAPTWAIFSAGYLNRWKMPVDAVVERYQQENIKTYNTSVHGMVTVEFSSKGTTIKSYRQSEWPFWFAN